MSPEYQILQLKWHKFQNSAGAPPQTPLQDSRRSKGPANRLVMSLL